jgi:hypothetical protein
MVVAYLKSSMIVGGRVALLSMVEDVQGVVPRLEFGR